MITIFTPTYNRKEKLEKLYYSLLEQEDKDFKWLIIDDGSTDNTNDLVKKWKKNLKIEYFFQKNSGKHIATNIAIKECKTDYMICVDSDDKLSKDAVSNIKKFVKTQFENDIWAIVGPRTSEKNTINRNWTVRDNTKCKFADIYCKYNFVGDTYIILNLKYVRKYSFPKIVNENFIPENVLYDLLDEKYFIKTNRYPLYISKYYDDGYTINSNKYLLLAPKGVALSNISSSSNKYNSIVKRVLCYTRFLSIIKVFKINKNDIKLLKRYKVMFYIKIISYLIFPLMYYRYYRKRKM